MPPSGAAPCQRIDLSAADGRARLESLRQRLVSQGELVSPAGLERTIAVFGEPLTPRQVVARICSDVRSGGIERLLDYTARLDGARITPETLDPPPDPPHRREEARIHLPVGRGEKGRLYAERFGRACEPWRRRR